MLYPDFAKLILLLKASETLMCTRIPFFANILWAIALCVTSVQSCLE